MTAVTQTYAAAIKAPWLASDIEPQTQFATFTFDDATPAQFPTMATIKRELARRSSFRDTDAVTTGDTWGSAVSDVPAALEIEKVQILYLFELKAGMSELAVAPKNIAFQAGYLGKEDTSLVWPAMGTSGLVTNLGGLTTFTIAGDDYLAGNVADADDTPPVVASISNAAALAGGVKAVQIGDKLKIALNGVLAYTGVFAAGSGVLEVPAADLATSGAGTHTLFAWIESADGRITRALSRTFTNS